MMKQILTALAFPSTFIKVPEQDNYMSKLKVNVDRLLDWQRGQKRYTSSNRHLYSFISSVPKKYVSSEYAIYDNFDRAVLENTHHYGIASVYNTVHPISAGVFSGRCREQWIAIPESSNVNRRQTSELKPIRCLWHPFNSLNFWINEEPNVTSNEVSFFIIDLNELSLLLNYYYKREKEPNVNSFIREFINPVLTEDIVNITMFNRISNIHYGKSNVDDQPRRIPTWLNIINDTNDFHERLFGEISVGAGGVNFLAQNIPLFREVTIFSFLSGLPDFNLFKNIAPLYFTSICRYLNLLLDLNITIRGITDSTLNNYLRNRLFVMENEDSALSSDLQLSEQQKRMFDNLKMLTR